jgi:predicted aspartyl protease
MKQKLFYLLGFFLIAGLCHDNGFAQSAKKTDFIEVPFEFYRNNVILQVKVNGKGPYNMLLDTGTSPSAIDLETAREIGLKIKPVDVGGSGTGSDKIVAYQTVLSEIQIGGLRAKNIAALAGESLSKISQQLGKPLKGVLGYSLLKNLIIQFDYPKRVIRFYATSPFSKGSKQPANRIILPFQLVDDTPLIEEIYVNGKKIRATLDTGSNGTLRLTSTAIKALGLEEEAQQAAPLSATGYAGTARYRKGQLKTLAVSTFVVAAPAVTFVMEKGEAEESAPEGNLGNVFMSNFSVTFDYRRKLVVFEKN